MNIVDELHAITAALGSAGIEGAHHLMIDLQLAEAAYADVLDDRVDVALPAGTITFVSRDTLLRMKRLAGRPIDLADIEKLESGDE